VYGGLGDGEREADVVNIATPLTSEACQSSSPSVVYSSEETWERRAEDD
jgi:hypothetical protein